MRGDKKLYIIAGCIGAGKTTASYNILPGILGCREFVNADEIARGLSPFHLNSVEMAKNRVKRRVSEGGHNIEEEVIERRYVTGIKNLFELYIPVCDIIILMDNSDKTSKFVMKIDDGNTSVYDENTLQKIKSFYHE